MSRVSGFNAQQEEAVYIRNKHVLVSAPADQGRHAFLSAGSWSCLKKACISISS